MATEAMTKSQYITLSFTIPIYNVLLDDQSNYFWPIPEVRVALNKEYEKLKSYYAKTDDSCLYPIATSN